MDENVLQQKIDNLKSELKCVKNDRDTKETMLLDMEACVIDIYSNAKTIEQAKEMCQECLHKTVKDAFVK